METDLDSVIEKRKFPRLESNLPIAIAHDHLKIKKSTCRNISEGGVCLEVELEDIDEKALWVIQSNDAKINIEISLINGQDKIKATAIIKWNKEIPLPDTRRYNWGMEFVEIEPHYKNRLASFVKDRIKPPKRKIIDVKEFKLLIGGEEVDTGQYRYFPYSEKVILQPEAVKYMLEEIKSGNAPIGYKDYIFARYCVGNGDINHQAIIAAYQASKIYRNFPLEKRTKIINDIHNLLLEKEMEFLRLLIIEGHPYKLAKWEIGGMLKGTDKLTLAFYKENIEKQIGQDNNETIYWVRRPDGVVCLSTPKNAPSSISVIGIFALLGGNTLIIKPPLSSPLSTFYFWKDIVNEALRKNEAPEGTVNIITGNSHTVMEEWISSPYTNSIIYIGNSRKGLEIGKKIYDAGKKPILELSGNDIMIVWKDAPIEQASDALLDSFLGSTQICMVPKVALIHEGIYERFKDRFIEKVKMLKPGLPFDTETRLAMVGKTKEFFITLKDALQKGAKLLCGGERTNHKGEPDTNGQFIQPTVLAIEDDPYIRDILCIREEIFFPLLPLIIVEGHSDEEIWNKIVEFTNNHGHGLRISGWTQSPEYVRRFTKEITNSGILRINSSHVEFSLYISNNGGVNKSGGPFGEMSYIWQKTTHLQGISISSLT